MKSYIVTIGLLCLISYAALLNAQSGVRISPTPIPNDPSAILNVQSANQGVLLPRTITSSVVSPTDGLIVFDTMLNHYMLYDQNQWTKLLKASAFNFYYADRDGDNHGDPFGAIYSMILLTGYVALGDDCNDYNASIFGGSTEVCDGVDNDCDGLIDELPDNDMDGSTICNDCNDGNPAIFPGAIEVCDGLDNDCDGGIDNVLDGDMDGFTICAGDCNDMNANIFPGAIEVCDGIDNDCDGGIDNVLDGDMDGFTICAGDCNDMNANIFPGAIELCDGMDNDCDGVIDNGC